MVKIREKRSESINPTRIDGELLVDVGQILRADCPSEHEIVIELDADSKEILTEDSKEFANIDIPSDTYRIQMAIRSKEETPFNPVEIELDVRHPKDSKIRVMGENATWVQGVAQKLVRAFEKKKLGYRHIAKYETIRTVMSLISSGLLTYVGGFVLWLFKVELLYILLFVVVFFYAMTSLIKRFFDWVFPFFEIESEGFLPRKVRKLALAFLWVSGILPTVVFWLLGLYTS